MNLARLRGRRVEMGYTQRKIAEEIGVSEYTYRLLEQGKIDPRASMVEKLCAKLQLSYDDFFYSDGC